MPHPTRVLVAMPAAALALAAGLSSPPPAAAAAVQRCSPTNTTHTLVVRLPGIKVAEQTCVIRFAPVGRVKAWVHTVWKRTSFRTRFTAYAVSARLEFRNIVDRSGSAHCRRYAHLMNTSRRGALTCEGILVFSQAKGWSGDGAIAYRVAGGRAHVRGLRGSPTV